MTINTNINALVAGNAYAAAAVDYAQATQRISTQLRVNSAKDDPVGIGMASALKAKIASYAKAADNINSGITALNTAGTALTNIQTVLTAMKVLATSSAGSTNSTTLASNQATFATYLTSIDSIANTAYFNGKSLLNGNTPTIKVQSGINAGDTTTLTFGNVLTSALGTGKPLALSSLGSSTTALASGDLIINGYTVGASLSTDDTTSYASNSGSAIAKVAAINRITSSSNVVAVVGNTDVAGTAQSTAGTGTAGTITINGTAISITLAAANDYATNRAAVVTAINLNTGQTGVTAVDNGSSARGVSLVASDGRNITVAFDGTNLRSTNTGVGAATTYAGTYTLRSQDQTSIAITSSVSGTLANADLALGTYSANVAQFSTKNLGALTTAPTAISTGDLALNGYSIGATYASDDTASDTTAASSTKATSGISLAAAINRQTTTTGVSAKVNSNVVAGTGFTAAAVSTIYLNGQSITAGLTTSSTIADVVSVINTKTGLTGVTASNNGSGVTLTASDGRNISIGTNTGVGSAIGISSMSGTSTSAALGTTYIAPVTLYASSTFTVASGTNGNTNFNALGFREGTYGGASSATKVSGLNISTATGGTNALTTLADAIDMVSSYQAQVGALTNVMGYQTTTSTNMTTVSTKAYGDIMNYNLAAETTALAVAQTKQNGAMAMLAQANVSQDLVTYLLKKYIN
ncbi:MAG: flagellin [Burkholderiales bacterium]|jgi:flagellin|nr:flagellin [Burkholderiales bacterium]